MDIKFKKYISEVSEFLIFSILIALSYFFGLFYSALIVLGLGLYIIVITVRSKDPSLGIGAMLGFILIVFGLVLLLFSDFPSNARNESIDINNSYYINPPAPLKGI